MYQILHLDIEGDCSAFSEGPDLRFLGFGFIHTMIQDLDLWIETHDGDDDDDDDDDYDDDNDDDDDQSSADIVIN